MRLQALVFSVKICYHQVSGLLGFSSGRRSSDLFRRRLREGCGCNRCEGHGDRGQGPDLLPPCVAKDNVRMQQENEANSRKKWVWKQSIRAPLPWRRTTLVKSSGLILRQPQRTIGEVTLKACLTRRPSGQGVWFHPMRRLSGPRYISVKVRAAIR